MAVSHLKVPWRRYLWGRRRKRSFVPTSGAILGFPTATADTKRDQQDAGAQNGGYGDGPVCPLNEFHAYDNGVGRVYVKLMLALCSLS